MSRRSDGKLYRKIQVDKMILPRGVFSTLFLSSSSSSSSPSSSPSFYSREYWILCFKNLWVAIYFSCRLFGSKGP